jgi:5,10-methylenetetrahydrofolate reductase
MAILLGSEPADQCPKAMTYGPCGGVRPSGRCEVGEFDCPFLAIPLPEWPTGTPVDPSVTPTHASPGAVRAGDDRADPRLNPRAAELAARLARRTVVVADFPARALDSSSLAACGAVLRDVDAVLVGDAPAHRVQFPPAYRAGLLAAAGARPWVGLNARDRNRVALEGECAALADVGVAAVHCVTGDHPRSGTRPDAAPVFDLDSTELTALASGRGLLVSVGESPAAPPLERRALRLLSKERAGADVCFVNHCGGVEPVARFVRQARELGSSAAMIACVPLVCDPGSAALLASFGEPGTDRVIEQILSAPHPRREGIRLALELGLRMLDTGLVSGINLSGGPADGGELAYAEALAETADRLAA